MNVVTNMLGYVHIGVHIEVLEDLQEKVEHHQEDYCVLIMDEMKIKEDLVYNKHTGQIVGYVNLGNVQQQLTMLEQNKKATDYIATHMLAFMVRGISTRLNYPIAHFTTTNLSAEQMYPLIWELVSKVERTGLKVVAITADGASQNRKFFEMHKDTSGSNVSNGVTYKTVNIVASTRHVYFVSDIPHLMKTVRNCWEKSRSGGPKLMQVRLNYICTM